MPDDVRSQVTEILNSVGEKGTVANKLLPMVYDDLHALAEKYLRAEPANHTLQPTALVHEAYMKLVDQTRVDWQGRTHFFAVGAQAMRRILVDHARRRRAAKRGGDRQRITVDEQLLAAGRRDEDVLALEEANKSSKAACRGVRLAKEPKQPQSVALVWKWAQRVARNDG